MSQRTGASGWNAVVSHVADSQCRGHYHFTRGAEGIGISLRSRRRSKSSSSSSSSSGGVVVQQGGGEVDRAGVRAGACSLSAVSPSDPLVTLIKFEAASSRSTCRPLSCQYLFVPDTPLNARLIHSFTRAPISHSPGPDLTITGSSCDRS